MVELLLWTTTILVAFVSGVIALFAPCCLTVLLPAYLGGILQSRLRVVAATFIFTLGIATVMLPIGLGLRAIVSAFNLYHTTAYTIAGAAMIVAAVLMLTNFKLPMIATPRLGKNATFGSLYILGIASGLASACCAPVLLAAATITSLSPSFALALFAAISFVLGMTLPLLAGALLMNTQWLMGVKKFLSRPVKGVSLGNLLGASVMLLYGGVIIFLALTGRIAMLQGSRLFGVEINSFGRNVTQFLEREKSFSIIGVIILILIVSYLVRRVRSELKKGVEVVHHH